MLKPHTAVILCLRRSFDFQGRSCRSEFWWFMAFTTVAVMGLFLVDDWIVPETPVGVSEDEYGVIGWINNWRLFPTMTAFGYLTLLPMLSVGVRRMHDIGRRGWPMYVYIALGEISFFLDPVKSQTGSNEAVEILSEISLTPYLNSVSVIYLGVVGLYLGFTIYLILIGMRDSHKDPNQYGPSPKYGDPVKAFD